MMCCYLNVQFQGQRVKIHLQDAGMDWIDLVEERDRYGNESVGSIKCGDFLE